MKNMLGFGLLGGVGLLLGCGGIAIIDDAGQGGGNGGSGTGAQPPDDVAAVGPTGAGGASGLSMNLSISSNFGNCQPEIPRDPLGFDYNIDYQNSGSEAVNPQVLQSRVFATDNPASFDWTFAVNGTGPGLLEPGAKVSQDYTKLPDTGFGAGTPCDSCGARITLEVDVAVFGAVTTLSTSTLRDGRDAALNCAF